MSERFVGRNRESRQTSGAEGGSAGEYLFVLSMLTTTSKLATETHLTSNRVSYINSCAVSESVLIRKLCMGLHDGAVGSAFSSCV